MPAGEWARSSGPDTGESESEMDKRIDDDQAQNTLLNVHDESENIESYSYMLPRKTCTPK